MHFDGAYFGGLARLGVIDPSQVSANATAHSAGTIPTLSPGDCTSDGSFIWRVDAQGNGYWDRLQQGEKCGAISSVGPGNVRTGQGGGVSVGPAPQHGPIVVEYNFDNNDASTGDPNDKSKLLQVGPFQIPLDAKSFNVHWTGILPDDWRAFIVPELAHDCSRCIFTSMEDATPGHRMGILRDFFGDDLPAQVNKDLVSIAAMTVKPMGPTSVLTNVIEIDLPDQPIAVVQRPDTGDTWGVFMVVTPRDPSYPWDSTTNPYVLNLFWRQQPQGVWDWIKRIVGDIVDAVGAIAGAAENAACQLLPTVSKVPNPYVQAGAIVLALSGACSHDCPSGMTYNDAAKACICPVGMSYDVTSKTCMVATNPMTIPWWVWVVGGVIGLGVIFKVRGERKKPEPQPAA